MTTTLSPKLLRGMMDQVNACPDNFVQFQRPIARMILVELIRLLESQGMRESERVTLIQRLTMEYCCAHICDLLIGLMDEENKNVATPELLQFAITQIEELANSITVIPQGHA